MEMEILQKVTLLKDKTLKAINALNTFPINVY